MAATVAKARVGYDGRDGTVTVTFRPPGIEALCRKAGLTGMSSRGIYLAYRD